MKNKIMSILNTKCKKVVAITTAVVIVAASSFGVYALLQEKNKLVLQDKTFVVEYGQSIPLDIDQYLDLSNLSKDEKEKVIKEAKVDSTAITNETDKEYPGIGQYMLTFIYQEEKVNAKVFVKDTKSPAFNTCDSVQFMKGTDFDYAQYIKAEDLQEVTYDFQKDTVKKDEVGDYKIKVVATDKSENKSEKEIQVKVLEAIDPTTHEATSSVDEKGNVVVTITEKPKVEAPIQNPQASGNNGSSTKPNGNGNSNSKPSGGGNTSSGSGSGGTTTPPTQPEAPHVHKSGNISPYFATEAELNQWKYGYMDENNIASCTYSGIKCDCGMWAIRVFRDIVYWQD